jgi:hypothetical protein
MGACLSVPAAADEAPGPSGRGAPDAAARSDAPPLPRRGPPPEPGLQVIHSGPNAPKLPGGRWRGSLDPDGGAAAGELEPDGRVGSLTLQPARRTNGSATASLQLQLLTQVRPGPVPSAAPAPCAPALAACCRRAVRGAGGRRAGRAGVPRDAGRCEEYNPSPLPFPFPPGPARPDRCTSCSSSWRW